MDCCCLSDCLTSTHKEQWKVLFQHKDRADAMCMEVFPAAPFQLLARSPGNCDFSSAILLASLTCDVSKSCSLAAHCVKQLPSASSVAPFLTMASELLFSKGHESAFCLLPQSSLFLELKYCCLISLHMQTTPYF